jgi:thioesterase domain-containing protein/acyl carrier protein
MLPSSFVLMKELPRTSSGKVDRRALPAPAAAGTERELIEPRDSVERELASIWREVLGTERVGVRDNFFEVGGHSLMAVRLMARVQQQFGRELPLATLFHAATIEALADLLRQSAEPPLWSPLVPVQTGGTRSPLFFVHPIGGQVLCYRELARRLGTDQPFYGLQAPPLAEVGGQSHSIEAMAAHYVEAVRSVRPEGPYFLGGWSFGGVAAFEMAQQLRAQGHEVRLLAMLDTGSPLRGRKFDLGDDATLLADFVREVAHQKGRELTLTAEDLRGIALDEQLMRVHAELRRVGLAPTDISPENYVGLMRRHLQGFKTRARAAVDYEPRVYAGRITLFRATEVDADVLETYRKVGVDALEPDMGWGELSSLPVEVRAVPGYHETMCQEPSVGTLAELLRACVDER